jgi:hypothetical protein
MYLLTTSLNDPSISHSPKGWTDQELRSQWLERDFELATAARNTSNGYRLLVLDGHNSHCTYRFCDFAAKHRIIVICLPSHTTHVLQPCDVGVFGPLSKLWKTQVNKASRANISINKTNLLFYYSQARKDAFKPSTIQSAFLKTGIYPLNPDIIDQAAFEPAKNTTTKSSQPLPARLPAFLLPLLESSTSTPTTSDNTPQTPATTQNQMRHLLIGIPPLLPQGASRQALLNKLSEFRAIAIAACEQVQKDHAQMVLMDGENERLRQLVFAKQKKRKKTQTSSHPRHMTGAENLEELARADWDSAMKGVYQEAVNVFKAQRKKIDNHYRTLAWADKLRQQRERAAEKLRVRMVKLAASEAEKAAKREERIRQRALKTAEVLQRKQAKSMTAQARKGKAPARGPTARGPLPAPFPVISSDSEDAATTEEEEEEEEEDEEVMQTGPESSAESSEDEVVAGPSQIPAAGVRRSSRLARLM